MEKIDEAQRSLDTANSTPVFEYVSVAEALNRTDAAIADGRHLLEDVPVSGTVLPQQTGVDVQKESAGHSSGRIRRRLRPLLFSRA